MPFAHNGATRIYWREDGSADLPLLLLLNPIGTDLSSWDRCLPLLTETFHVLRMDNRGHGASDVPAGNYSLSTLAEDADSVLRASGNEAALVCGISLGGMIAMQMAISAPSSVQGLVLVCTSAAMDKSVWQARLDTLSTGGLPAIEP